MKLARYSQDTNVSHTLVVLKEHKDGTVDLGRTEEGEAIVTNCPLSDEPKVGHAVLIKDKAPAAESKPKK